MNIRYYQQTPIMKRILDHTENSVYVLGTKPYEASTQFRRYADIMNAMGDGSDIYRSLIDFAGVNFFLDLEYGNKIYPGEIFHRQIESFEKMEGLRKSLKDYLDKNEVPYLELMTGQGYNYSSKIKRDSASYKALAEIGSKLKVLPWSAAKKLVEKEQKHGNIPLLQDSLVFGALGRITEQIYNEMKKKYKDLPLETSDVYENNEMAIFDTTQYGYLLYKRSNRIAFSLHQKSIKKPELNYNGPPISTITPGGLTIENRIAIRSDERDNYKKAAELANETKTNIPETDISALLTNYLLSETYKEHLNMINEMPTKKLDEQEALLVQKRYPEISPEEMFWEVPKQPDWNIINSARISSHARKTIDNPNDLLLKPWDIKHLIHELRSQDVPTQEIISLITFKYSEPQHNWGPDLNKNNPELRAEYWVRTLT